MRAGAWSRVLLAAAAARGAGGVMLTRGSVLPPQPGRTCACCDGAFAVLRAQEQQGAVSEAAVAALQWYKKTISPLLPPGCRFVPTCSEYAIQSFKQFNPCQATVLTVWRLVRCNPTAGYGVDQPQWPPPGYWAGSGTVRTPLDDERSRQAGGSGRESPFDDTDFMGALADLDPLGGGGEADDAAEPEDERSDSDADSEGGSQ